MSEYVEKQKAIDIVDKYLNSDGCNGSDVAMDIISGLINLPSAEPEIIRCKDCKWFGRLGCAISIVDKTDKPKDNDFCSFAERRDDI